MLLRIEIFTFLLAFLYILYFFGDMIFVYYTNKKLELQEKEQRRKLREQKHKNESVKTEKENIEKNNAKEIKSPLRDKDSISPEQSEQLREISKRAQVNISRGYFESAQSLIIE
jgi:hypothetical protein